MSRCREKYRRKNRCVRTREQGIGAQNSERTREEIVSRNFSTTDESFLGGGEMDPPSAYAHGRTGVARGWPLPSSQTTAMADQNQRMTQQKRRGSEREVCGSGCFPPGAGRQAHVKRTRQRHQPRGTARGRESQNEAAPPKAGKMKARGLAVSPRRTYASLAAKPVLSARRDYVLPSPLPRT